MHGSSHLLKPLIRAVKYHQVNLHVLLHSCSTITPGLFEENSYYDKPSAEATWWKRLGPEERWRAFFFEWRAGSGATGPGLRSALTDLHMSKHHDERAGLDHVKERLLKGVLKDYSLPPVEVHFLFSNRSSTHRSHIVCPT